MNYWLIDSLMHTVGVCLFVSLSVFFFVWPENECVCEWSHSDWLSHALTHTQGLTPLEVSQRIQLINIEHSCHTRAHPGQGGHVCDLIRRLREEERESRRENLWEYGTWYLCYQTLSLWHLCVSVHVELGFHPGSSSSSWDEIGREREWARHINDIDLRGLYSLPFLMHVWVSGCMFALSKASPSSAWEAVIGFKSLESFSLFPPPPGSELSMHWHHYMQMRVHRLARRRRRVAPPNIPYGDYWAMEALSHSAESVHQLPGKMSLRWQAISGGPPKSGQSTNGAPHGRGLNGGEVNPLSMKPQWGRVIQGWGAESPQWHHQVQAVLGRDWRRKSLIDKWFGWGENQWSWLGWRQKPLAIDQSMVDRWNGRVKSGWVIDWLIKLINLRSLMTKIGGNICA